MSKATIDVLCPKCATPGPKEKWNKGRGPGKKAFMLTCVNCEYEWPGTPLDGIDEEPESEEEPV